MLNKKNYLIITFIFILVIISLLSNCVFANNESIQMIEKNKSEYIIYISGIDKKFEFAFSNNSKVDKTSLVFKESALDKTESGNNIAFIDSNLYDQYFKDKKETFLWIKQGTEYKLEAEKVKLADALTQEDIDNFNNKVTKTIAVEVGQKELPKETVDGVTVNRKIGILKLVNNEVGNYSYKIMRATEGSDAKRLIELANKMNELNGLNENAMFEKLSVYSEFKTLYNKLKPKVDDKNWTQVKDNIIEQPQDSKKGEQYLVWIKQETDNDSVIDVQIMTCDDSYKPEYEKQESVIKETTRLPITGDNIVLFVIAGIVIALIVIVSILKFKDNEKRKHSA